MGTKIKTAWEKALERFEEKTKHVSSADILRMECLQEGQKLVGRYLAEPRFKLTDAFEQYDPEKKGLVLKAVEETLLNRLVLPENERALQDDRRVMEGLMAVKENKQLLSSIFGEMEHLFNYYLQAREQARESLEQDFSSRIEEAMQKRGIRPGPGVRVNPAGHPQFQEEWSRLSGDLNKRFLPALEQLRRKIKVTE